MSVRVGESWTNCRGHRRWVSMPLGGLLGGGLFAVLLAGPFWLVWMLLLAELWVCAELLFLSLTGLIALIAVVRREIGFADLTVIRLRWHLHTIGLKERAA